VVTKTDKISAPVKATVRIMDNSFTISRAPFYIVKRIDRLITLPL
jgi:hypothetical protein